MFKRAFFVAVVVALALPLAAAAKVYELDGKRAGFMGNGAVTAELTASDSAKPVKFAQVGGTFEVTGDAEVKCRSRGANGDKSSECSGKAVLAVITGSHFTIKASGKWALGIPAGYTGTVDAANAKQCGKEINCRNALRNLRQGGGKSAGEGKTADGGAKQSDADMLAELQAALAAIGQ